MDSPVRATVPLTGSPRQDSPGQWRDTPKAKAYFQAWGKVWGGKDGLIAQAARQGKGQ